jgi:hypothetical protein
VAKPRTMPEAPTSRIHSFTFDWGCTCKLRGDTSARKLSMHDAEHGAECFMKMS